jgi:hypothetical protein
VASSHDICCDLPRGEFPYLEPSNLVVFGHLIWSCVNTSHVGNASLPFSCVLQFTSDSASLVRSFARNILTRLLPSHYHHLRTPSPCRHNPLLSPENPQLAPHKVCTRLFFTIFSGSMARMGTFETSQLEALISPQDWARMHTP